VPTGPGTRCTCAHQPGLANGFLRNTHQEPTNPSASAEAEQECQPDDRTHDHRDGTNDGGLVGGRTSRHAEVSGSHHASPPWPLTCATSDGRRRMPTGRIAISGPSTSTKEFGLCIVRPTPTKHRSPLHHRWPAVISADGTTDRTTSHVARSELCSAARALRTSPRAPSISTSDVINYWRADQDTGGNRLWPVP
jgi:hypothetical protein